MIARKWIVATAVVALLGAAGGIWIAGGRSGDRPPPETGEAPLAATAAAPDRPPPAVAAPEAPESVVTLRVVDDLRERPVAGALVRPEEGGEAVASGEAGEVVLGFAPGLPLLVTAEGYYGRRVVLPRARPPGGVEVRLTPPGLHRIRRLAGRVVRDGGIPVPRASVVVEHVSGIRIALAADGNGEFRVRVPCDLAVGESCLVRASHPLYGEGAVGADFMAAAWRLVSTVGPLEVTVRIGPGREMPLSILEGGEPSRRGFVLLREERDVGWEPVRGRAVRTAARDGDRVRLPSGLWRLTLLDADGSPAAAGLDLVVAGDTVRRVHLPPGHDPTKTFSMELDAIRFDVGARSARVRVVSGGKPVAGAEVTLELARDADPRGRTYEERDLPGGLRPGAVTGGIGEGRRAPAVHRRVALTREDGVAAFRGWLPEPAVLTVRAEGYVVRYLEVPAWPDPGADPLEAEVVRGAVLDFRFPDWLDSTPMRRLDAEGLWLVRRGDPPLAVPPGEYLVRVRRWDGAETPREAPLVPAFRVAAGERRVVDLTAVRPMREIRFRLAPPHADGPVQRRSYYPPRLDPFVDGVLVTRYLIEYPDRRVRLRLRWVGESGVVHEHEAFWPLGRESEDVDLGYAGGGVDLALAGDVAAAAQLSLHAQDPDAPGTRGHTAWVSLPGAAGAAIPVRDLPPGRYGIRVANEDLVVDPSEVTVGAGTVVAVTVRLRLQAVRIRLRPEDPSLAPADFAGDHLRILPAGAAGDSRPRWSFGVDDRGTAWCPRLPPGRYRVAVNRRGEMVPVGGNDGVGRWRYVYVELGEIDVAPGVSEVEVAVPVRKD